MPHSHRVNIHVPGAIALEVLQFPSPPHPPGPPIFLAGGPFVGPVAGNQVTVRTKKFLPFPFPSHAPAAVVVHAWFPPQDAGPAFQIFPLLITGNTTKVLIQNQPFQPPSPNEVALLVGLLATGGGGIPGILDQLHTQGSEHASQTGAVHRTPVATKGKPARIARLRAAKARRAQRKVNASVSRYARGRKARYQGAYGQDLVAPDRTALDAGARAASARLFGPGAEYSGFDPTGRGTHPYTDTPAAFQRITGSTTDFMDAIARKRGLGRWPKGGYEKPSHGLTPEQLEFIRSSVRGFGVPGTSGGGGTSGNGSAPLGNVDDLSSILGSGSDVLSAIARKQRWSNPRAARAYGQAEVPPNTVPGMSDTIFCKRYPLTCANMQALGHTSYGSQTARDITDIEFDEVNANGDAENGTENGGWFTEEVVDRPGRTAAIAAVAGLGIWGLMSMRGPRY